MKRPFYALLPSIVMMAIYKVEGGDIVNNKSKRAHHRGAQKTHHYEHHHHHRVEALNTDSNHFLQPADKAPRAIDRAPSEPPPATQSGIPQPQIEPVIVSNLRGHERPKAFPRQAMPNSKAATRLPIGFAAPPAQHFRPTSFKITLFYLLYTLGTTSALILVIWLAYAKLPNLLDTTGTDDVCGCCLRHGDAAIIIKPHTVGPRVLTITRSYFSTRMPVSATVKQKEEDCSGSTNESNSAAASCCSSFTSSPFGSPNIQQQTEEASLNSPQTPVSSTAGLQSAFMSPIGSIT